ncbi:uncharacterized protein [Nicotiana tomentosiformis]|uniref:uncharacterized protein isoform X1 n=1 Tax=Nicotiana tomentosiformis TaxID=4098 RepID=UPI00388CD329
MTEPLTDSNSDAWLDLLRRMLPAGAPLPDEEQLDYSIAVEYKGPPLDFPVPVVDPLASSQSTLTKLPKFRKVPSVYSKFAMHVKENSSGSGSGSSCSASRLRMNSSSESESKIPTDQSISEFNNSGNAPAVDTDENAENEYENDNDDKYDSVDRNEYNLARPIDVDDKSLPEGEKNGKNDRLGVKIRAHACSRCGKNNRLREREFCIVCGARYCRNCLLKAMGSMPEGRKCVGCIGEPIDEANREKLGKCSRLLAKICSPLEVKLIMKAESECLANQIQPEQVWVNGRPLREEELVELLGCAIPPQKLRPEKYWYDKDSGLWGKEGEKPDRIISSKLNVGGKLQIDASKGNTKVFINGREITKVELRVLKLAKVQCQRGTHFWVYDDGSYEEEGQNNIRGNIWGKASTRFICSLFSLPVPPGNIHGPKEDATAFSGRSIPEYLEHGRLQTLLLFGLEGSGTSTIFKQVKFISKSKFTVEEVQNIKLTIQRNIYRYLSVLLEGREHFEEEVLMDKKTSDLEMENFSPGRGQTIGTGRESEGLYYLNSLSPSTTCLVTDPPDLIHRRLGHPSLSKLQKMVPSLSSLSTLDCESCQLGKHTRASFSRSVESHAESVFSLVHFDIWGPSRVSSTLGFRYFVSFIDDYSRCTWLFLMKDCSELFSIFQSFCAEIKNQFGVSFRIFRSDNALEYLSSQFQQFMTSQRIIHQTSCPYTPLQNGIAERKNRHIIETRTLLIESRVPLRFWGDAVLTTCYLINRMPSSPIKDQIPHSVLFPQSPLYSLSPRVFGSTCFVHNLAPRKDKLAPRALKCVFLGYSRVQKGYRCYSPDLRRYLMLADVTFFESKPFFTSADHHDISEVLPIPAFEEFTIAPPPTSTTEVSSIPTVEESSVVPPSSPATGTPLLTYHRRSRPTSGLTGSRPTLDPAPAADPAPSTPIALRKGIRTTLNPNPHYVGLSYHRLPSPHYAFISSLSSVSIPKSTGEALSHPGWRHAMSNEMSALHTSGTWELVPLPSGKSTVGCRWVYVVKVGPDG